MRSRFALGLVLVGCQGSGEAGRTSPLPPSPPPDASAPPPLPPSEPSPSACPAGRTCITLAASESEARVAEAFATAKPGTTILLGEGTFTPTNTLALAADDVTVRGAGRDRTILDFRGQKAGSEGVLAENANRLVLESFSVVETPGNGLKVLEADAVILRNIGVRWTSEDATSHGAYGLYPVRSRRVLVEDCVVRGASDAGIYVGQSNGATLRRNVVTGNVAGIELENTSNVDAHDNRAVGNTAGVLVVDLPWVPITGGGAIRVHHNVIAENNVANFSPKGSFVGALPRGTGLLIMAGHDIDVSANTIRDHASVNAAVVSFLVTGNEVANAEYDPYPSRIFVHDNRFGGGGNAPDATKRLGAVLEAGSAAYPDGLVPTMVNDGIIDPAKGRGDNPQELCIVGNGSATFANLHLDEVEPDLSDLAAFVTFDLAPHDCALPPVVPEMGEP